MTKPKKPSPFKIAVEWVGGIVSLPFPVPDGSGRVLPILSLAWLSDEGELLSLEPLLPGTGAEAWPNSLHKLIGSRSKQKSSKPTRVRVAQQDIAANLASQFADDIEIFCRPTPELAALQETFSKMPLGAVGQTSHPNLAPSYLQPGISPQQVEAFFDACGTLWFASPWDTIPTDTCTLRVDIPSLDVEGACISVLGAAGQTFGFAVFANDAEFGQFLDAARSGMPLENRKRFPAHFAMSFTPRADVDDSKHEEISQHGWPVFEDMVPEPVAHDVGLQPRHVSARELAILEIVALALGELAIEDDDFAFAWNRGKSLHQSLSVKTFKGARRIDVRAPYLAAAKPKRTRRIQASSHQHSSFDIYEEVFDGDSDAFDDAWFQKHRTELLAGFEVSPEWRSFGARELRWIGPFIDIARRQLEVTLPRLTLSFFEEILFEIFPADLPIPPDDALLVVQELKAFMAYVGREFGLRTAEECAQMLDEGAAEFLFGELSDSTNFSVAKTMMTHSFMPQRSLARALTAVQTPAKKAKAKAQKTARKKNR